MASERSGLLPDPCEAARSCAEPPSPLSTPGPGVLEWSVCDDVTDGSDENEGRPSLEGADMTVSMAGAAMLATPQAWAHGESKCCAVQAAAQAMVQQAKGRRGARAQQARAGCAGRAGLQKLESANINGEPLD